MPKLIYNKRYSQFLISLTNQNWSAAYLIPINSTSNTRVAPGGITPPAPADP